MSTLMADEIKRWALQRKAAFLQDQLEQEHGGKTGARVPFPLGVLEQWADESKCGI